MRKLIVFDLDQTLVDGRFWPVQNEKHGLACRTIVINNVTPVVYAYIRPHARTVLHICRGDPQISIVLFSAGDREYVYKIIDELLLPVMGQSFYFDAIYCKDDLDEGGVKNMGRVMRDMHADRAILVDDLIGQCIYGAGPHENVDWFNIKPFDAGRDGADKDKELFELLKCSFFYC